MNREQQRFHAAAAAMRGLLTHADWISAGWWPTADASIDMADALLEQLDKRKPKPKADALLAELDRTAVVKESLTPQPDADGWIPHKPGDPMPCLVKAKIHIQTEGGYMSSDWSYAYTFDWSETNDPDSNIIAWKPA